MRIVVAGFACYEYNVATGLLSRLVLRLKLYKDDLIVWVWLVY